MSVAIFRQDRLTVIVLPHSYQSGTGQWNGITFCFSQLNGLGRGLEIKITIIDIS